MKRIKIFINIFFVLFSLNVWSQDSSTFELPKERIEELEEKSEIKLRMWLMFYMTMLSSVKTAQEVNEAIGITSDSTRLMIPYSLGFFLPSYYAVESLYGVLNKRPEWFIKRYLGAKDYQWFSNFNKLISEIVKRSRKILSLRVSMELESYYADVFSSSPSERNILKDVRGRTMSSSYDRLYGDGMRQKAVDYQTLLNRFENNPTVPDRDANIKIVKSLIQYEKEIIDLKGQLSTHMKTNPYPGVKKHLMVKAIRGSGVLLSSVGMIALGFISFSSISVAFADIPLSEVRKNLQAEVDYILYLLAQSSESDDSAAGF